MSEAPPLILKCRDVIKKHGNFMIFAGMPGSGKTHLIRTLPNLGRSLVVDFEGGLRTVADCDVDVAEIRKTKDFDRLLDELEHGSLIGQYDFLFIDGLTALGDMVLAEQNQDPKEYMAKYGKLIDLVMGYCKRFKLMPIDVVATCGVNRNIDNGLYELMQPGRKLPVKITYEPDFVGACIVKQKADGSTVYGIQFANRSPYEFCKARDPYRALDDFEKPDLKAIFEKLETAETKTTEIKGAA